MTRREFLRRTTHAGAFAALSNLDAHRSSLLAHRSSHIAHRSSHIAHRASDMFVSLNGALPAGKNVGWPEFGRLAARGGYGGVDWSLSAAQAEGLDATKRLFAELRIKPTIANLPMARPFPFAGEETAFREALVKLADEAGFSAAIGCRSMMVVLPPTGPL